MGQPHFKLHGLRMGQGLFYSSLFIRTKRDTEQISGRCVLHRHRGLPIVGAQ